MKKQGKQPILAPGYIFLPEAAEKRRREALAPAKPAANIRLPEQVMIEILPAAILLDNQYRVIFSHGDTSKYLSLPEGKPSLEIQELVRSELRAFLISGLHEAASQRKEVVRESAIKSGESYQPVRLDIKPVAASREGEPPLQYIVTFQALPEPQRRKKGGIQVDAVRCQELEKELQFTKETLRGTIEELETANEELRSANE